MGLLRFFSNNRGVVQPWHHTPENTNVYSPEDPSTAILPLKLLEFGFPVFESFDPAKKTYCDYDLLAQNQQFSSSHQLQERRPYPISQPKRDHNLLDDQHLEYHVRRPPPANHILRHRTIDTFFFADKLTDTRVCADGRKAVAA